MNLLTLKNSLVMNDQGLLRIINEYADNREYFSCDRAGVTADY